MASFQQRVEKILAERRSKGSLRQLRLAEGIDFSSNDYLGLARSPLLKECLAKSETELPLVGSTGSRLLSGHHALMAETEAEIARFHQAPTALLFNSGYAANLSLLSCLPRKGDIILFDALLHASLRDGLRLNLAHTYKFAHNDLSALKQALERHAGQGQCFVVVESVYSMDGDRAPLQEIVDICETYAAILIVDEAHATGVLGAKGQGWVQALGLAARVPLRVHTFGKALGGHGAVVLAPDWLRSYLVNFARPFIYTTAPSLHSVLAAREAYRLLEKYGQEWVAALQERIAFFRKASTERNLNVLDSQTAIQGILFSDTARLLHASSALQAQGFDLRPIRYPTVPKGKERIRICLHRYNTEQEIEALADALVATMAFQD